MQFEPKLIIPFGIISLFFSPFWGFFSVLRRLAVKGWFRYDLCN